jgi:hypothetical protein
MIKPRSNLAIPPIPGGYFLAPEECPKARNYRPNEKYLVLQVAEYARCSTCKLQDGCLAKQGMDAGRKKRIWLQKNGE